jgi:uncharacterized protein (DUF433 family)
MGKFPKDASRSRVVAALEALGFQIVRERGDVGGDAAGGNPTVTSPPARDNLGPVAACKIKLLPPDTRDARPYTYRIDRRKVCMTHNLIQSDPDVMTGKPVVRGTRITVETILRKLSCGESIEQLLESHPRLTRESVLAALEYAAEAMAHETVHAVAEPDLA